MNIILKMNKEELKPYLINMRIALEQIRHLLSVDHLEKEELDSRNNIALHCLKFLNKELGFEHIELDDYEKITEFINE